MKTYTLYIAIVVSSWFFALIFSFKLKTKTIYKLI